MIASILRLLVKQYYLGFSLLTSPCGWNEEQRERLNVCMNENKCYSAITMTPRYSSNVNRLLDLIACICLISLPSHPSPPHHISVDPSFCEHS